VLEAVDSLIGVVVRKLRAILLWNFPKEKIDRPGFYWPALFLWACWAYFEWRAVAGHPVYPGEAIGALALAAAIMAVRADKFKVVEKIFWVIVCASLLIWELKVIDDDHATQERQHLAELREQQHEFDRTLKETSDIEQRTTSILDRTGNVADLASEGLANLLGSKSYPLIFPIASPQPDSFYLMVSLLGKHIVWDTQLVSSDRYVDQSFFTDDPALKRYQLQPIVLGDVGRLGPVIAGSKDKETHIGFASTSRGTVSQEDLAIRWNATAKRWEFQYWLFAAEAMTSHPRPPRLLKHLKWTAISAPTYVSG
jgi:hypothetical protein